MGAQQISGWVSRVLTFSCVDGPGNRLVLFLQGCNFDCRPCHNPHTINRCNHCGDCVPNCPAEALKFEAGQVVWDESRCTGCDRCIEVCSHKSNPKIKQMTVDDVITLLHQHRCFLSGVTVSGGEATVQLPFVLALFRAIKADSTLNHLSCFVDSNGYLSEKGWEQLLPVMDGAMIDLKAWNDDTHRWLVGRSNHRVIHSIRLLAARNKLHEVRLLHIPDVSDHLQAVEALAALFNQLPESVSIRLNAFAHHGVTGEALSWQRCDKAAINELAHELSQNTQRRIVRPVRFA